MKSRTRWTIAIALLTLASATTALARNFPAVLSGAVTELSHARQVPVLLPTVIPVIVSQYGIKRVVAQHYKSGYSVTLYYAEQTSEASFAGMVKGSSILLSPSPLPNTTSVRLANGTPALFSPVACGGSCAPANLWWQVGGFEYSLQLKLRSTLSVNQQRRALIEMANSMTAVH